jgi:hypothetical protein
MFSIWADEVNDDRRNLSVHLRPVPEAEHCPSLDATLQRRRNRITHHDIRKKLPFTHQVFAYHLRDALRADRVFPRSLSRR